MLFAIARNCLSSSGIQFLSGKNDDRYVAQTRFALHFFEQGIAVHVRQTQIQHTTIKLVVHQFLEGLRPGPHCVNFNVIVLEQFHHAVALDFVVFHDEQALGARLDESFDAVEALFQPFRSSPA